MNHRNKPLSPPTTELGIGSKKSAHCVVPPASERLEGDRTQDRQKVHASLAQSGTCVEIPQVWPERPNF